MLSFELGHRGLVVILIAAVLAAAVSFGSGLILGAAVNGNGLQPAGKDGFRISATSGVQTTLPPAAPRPPEIRRPFVPGPTVRPQAFPNRLVYTPYSRTPFSGFSDTGTRRRVGPPVLRYRAGQRVPPTPFGDLIYEHARRRKLNPDLVAAVIWVESGFNPQAVSRKGAIGLMQVIPATAQRFDIDPRRLKDPVSNISAGTRYLDWLGDRYQGNIPLTLAAYNAGDGAVDRWGGIPPYDETRKYVRKVLTTFDILGNRVSG